MRRLPVVMVAAALLLALAPFAHSKGGESEDQAAESPALVFGSIDGVPGMKHVFIQKLGKVYVGNINRPKTLRLDNGAFYFDDVPPGEYWLAGFSRGRELFWFPYTKETVKPALFTVEAGSVRFMGSYRVTEISRRGLLTGKGSFDIERVDSPAEGEILERVASEVAGSRWAPLVEARRKEVTVAATE